MAMPRMDLPASETNVDPQAPPGGSGPGPVPPPNDLSSDTWSGWVVGTGDRFWYIAQISNAYANLIRGML